jgi:hypothetical protein
LKLYFVIIITTTTTTLTITIYEHVCCRNTLVILDYKTEFNVKGQLTDKIDNGQLKGEFDLTLPTGHHFTGKVSITIIL